MANGIINISWTTTKLESRIVWESVGNAQTNTSSVTAELQIRRTDAYYTSGKWGVYFYGGTKDNTFFETNSFSPIYEDTAVSAKATSSWTTLATIKNTSYPHDNNGNAKDIVFYVKVWAPAGTTQEGESCEHDGRLEDGAIKLDTIHRQANLLSAPNFNDEENPTITYSNPNGANVTSLQACISLKGNEDTIKYRDIPKTATSYTFELTDEERNILRAAAANANSIQAQFFIKTVIGTTTLWSSLSKTFTVINNEPALVPSVRDGGTISTQLTGNPNTMIKGYNTMYYDIGAVAVKGATITSQSIVCGSQKSEAATGILEYVDSNVFVFNATDSRGNKAKTTTITLPMIDYTKLTCSQEIEIVLAEADKDEVIANISISGDYFNGSFGAQDNTLTIWLRHTQNDGNMGEWVPLTDGLIPTFSGNTYKLDITVSGLLPDKVYTFQCMAIDKIATIETEPYTTRLTPVFDWSESDFNFNVPIHIKGKEAIRINDTGRLVLSADNGGIYLRPNGTDNEEAQVVIDTEGNISVNGVTLDYIVEQGTEAMGSNGTWYWSKWKSGKAECYGVRNFGNMACSTAWGALFETADLSQNFPSGLFKDKPQVLNIDIMSGGFGVWVIRGHGVLSSSTTGTFNLVRANSQNLSQVNISFHAIGTWQ